MDAGQWASANAPVSQALIAGDAAADNDVLHGVAVRATPAHREKQFSIQLLKCRVLERVSEGVPVDVLESACIRYRALDPGVQARVGEGEPAWHWDWRIVFRTVGVRDGCCAELFEARTRALVGPRNFEKGDDAVDGGADAAVHGVDEDAEVNEGRDEDDHGVSAGHEKREEREFWRGIGGEMGRERVGLLGLSGTGYTTR